MSQSGEPFLGTRGGASRVFAFRLEFGRVDAADADKDDHMMLWPGPRFDEERIAIDNGNEFSLDGSLDRRTQIITLRRDRRRRDEEEQGEQQPSTHERNIFRNCSRRNRKIFLQLEVYCPAVYLPVAESGRIGSATAADLGRHFIGFRSLAPHLGFRQRTFRGWGQHLRRRSRRLAFGLMIGLGHENIELEAA